MKGIIKSIYPSKDGSHWRIEIDNLNLSVPNGIVNEMVRRFSGNTGDHSFSEVQCLRGMTISYETKTAKAGETYETTNFVTGEVTKKKYKVGGVFLAKLPVFTDLEGRENITAVNSARTIVQSRLTELRLKMLTAIPEEEELS